MTVLEASSALNVNLNTAKSILRKFRQSGTIDKSEKDGARIIKLNLNLLI